MKKAFFLFSILLIVFMGFSCKIEAENPAEIINLASPDIYPPAGDYRSSELEISIEGKNDNSVIYYTTDGTEPTEKSSKYISPFPIKKSSTIKAIAITDELRSLVATANYELGVGKNPNQTGLIHGRVILSENLSDEVKSTVKDDIIYIFSSELPGIIKKTKVGEEYYFDNLDITKSYSFYFTNQEPGNVIESRSANRGISLGHTIIATNVQNQKPVAGAGLNLDATLKITGKIRGTAVRYDINGNLETDNSGTIVFIPGTSYSALTDKTGKFEISGVPQGIYTIRAQNPTYSAQEIESIVLQNADSTSKEEPVFTIDKKFELFYGKGKIQGVAILEEAGEKENFGINVVIKGKDNNQPYSAITSSDGKWGVTELYPGTYSIEYSKDGYVPITTENVKITGAKITEVPKVELKIGGCSVSGNVVLRDYEDNSGIQLLLKKIPTENNPKEMTYYGLTDKNGNFSIYNVMPGNYTITASYPGFCSVSLDNISLIKGTDFAGANLATMGKKTTSISGKVILEGLKSFEGSSVILSDIVTKNQIDSAITGKDGIYIFNNVEPGQYLITASHDEYLSSTGTNVGLAPHNNVVVDDITLNKALGKIKGTVKLESNTDFSGISVLLYSDKSDKTYTTTTDAEGSYSFADIEPGIWKVQVTKNGYITKISDAFSVSAGNLSKPIDLLMKITMRSIYGNVNLEGRTDFTGIKITATNIANPTEIYSALSNKEGFFVLTGLTPSEYVLSYAFDNYVTFTSSSINVQNDNSLELSLVELKKAMGRISGIVNLEGCTDHSGVIVELVGTDKTYITGVDGKYDFLVPSGNYIGGVRFTKEDYTTSAKAETITVLTDSTYGVTTVKMKANATTVTGVVDLLGTTDDSNITVTIDGIDSSICSTTTDINGNWTLYHVPLGLKTIRFRKLNVPDVSTQKNIVPGNLMDLGKLEMIPNSATLKGYVYLNDMTDSSNITVTVKTSGKEDIVVQTTSDGAFEINNVLANGSPTVIFSKDGWDNKSIVVDNLKPLETRVIGQNREYVLVDTTAPMWNKTTPIILNGGANFANSYNIQLDLSAFDNGSGIEEMSIQVVHTVNEVESSKYPSIYSWKPYKKVSNFDIETLPSDYIGNGDYTLYIALKDKAGNISITNSNKITLTDMLTSLSGVLTNEKLHLTKESSPYLVEQNCLVGRNDTLVIDPGVEIRFAGYYELRINGCINALGTPTEKILFRKSDNATASQSSLYTWKGIVISGGYMNTINGYEYLNGNIMDYCEIEDAECPLYVGTNSYISNCKFGANYIVPEIREGNNIVLINNIFEKGLHVNFSAYTYKIINNIIKGEVDFDGTNGIIKNNDFKDSVEILFDGDDGNKIFNNNFINTKIRLQDDPSSYSKDRISYNNFIDCPSPLISATKNYSDDDRLYDVRNNFFGPSNTQELEYKGSKADISFINDYYNDYTLCSIDYSNWLKNPLEECGYNKNGVILVDFRVTDTLGKENKELKDNNLTVEIIPNFCKNKLESIRIAQSQEELSTKSWEPYAQSIRFKADTSKLNKGMATIFVQVKDVFGKISSIATNEIAINTPPTVEINLKDNQIFQGSIEEYELPYKIYDNGEIVKKKLYIDNVETILNYHTTLPISFLSSGVHEIKLVVYDALGNKAEACKTIKVERNIDNSIYAGTTYNKTTGQFIKDNNTNYLWHLDTDGKELNQDTSLDLQYSSARGGFNGSAKVAKSEIPIDTSSKEFTIEFWGKGNGFILRKLDVIDFSFNDFRVGEIEPNSNSHSYTERISSTNPEDDNWHYYACVLGNGYYAIYRDGLIQEYAKIDNKLFYNNNNPMEIENYILDNSDSFFDEIRISKCARSCDEIATYYKDAKKVLLDNSGSLDGFVW